jgi:phage baseplate assembly protein gpV
MDPNSDNSGFVDGSFYNTGNPPPTMNPNCKHVTFADGTVIEYAEAQTTGRSGQGLLTIQSQYPISITCGSCTLTATGTATVTASQIVLAGPVHITDTLQVDGVVNFKAGGSANPKITNSDGSGGGS